MKKESTMRFVIVIDTKGSDSFQWQLQGRDALH